MSNQFEQRADHAQWGFLWYREHEIFQATEADIAKIAADFKASGITHVMTFSSTHFRWNVRSYWTEINETIRKVVEACHALGIYVVEHHSCNLFCGYRTEDEKEGSFRRVKPEDYPKLVEDMQLDSTCDGVQLKDMVQYSGRTGEPLWVDLYHAWSMCTNNPLYRERYFKYLESVYAQGVDGIMTDDVEFYDIDSCACPHCRKLFTEQYNMELPASGDSEAWEAMLADNTGKLFLAWKNFRYNSSKNFHQAVVDHYTSLGLNMLRPNYIATSLSWANPWAYVFDDLPKLDWGFQECCCGAIRYSWPEYVLEAHHRSAVCRRYNVPAMSLYYPSNENILKMSWALSLYCNHKYLGTTFDKFDLVAAEKPFRAFENKHFDLLNNLTLNSRLGIYDSARSRELDGDYSDKIHQTICGVGQACIFNNILFDIVSYRDSQNYGKYEVIVVSSSRFMADDEIAQLGDFMRSGGTLIWCEECGLGDNEKCEMRTFAQVLELIGEAGKGKLMVLPFETLAVPSYKRCFTYGTDDDGEAQRVPSDGAWQPFTTEKTNASNELAKQLISELKVADIELTNAPKETLVSAFHSCEGTFTIQLINASNTLCEDIAGNGFGHADPIPFAKCNEAVTLSVLKPAAVSTKSYTKAKLHLLAEDSLEIAVTENNNRIEFTIPAGVLADYILVELI